MCVHLTDRALRLTECASGDPIRLKQCAPETALYCAFSRASLQAATAKDATLYTRADRDVRADQARLERDGKLAANLAETVEKEAQQPAPKMTEQEKRVQEARERIKAQRDRERDDNEKGKSRGHGR